ncbi:cyclic nucleotide-binding domain-containing protein [Nibribacter ruber]|uniref:Cyclic nucleotide-binding domain-containing protein n=1 Tax=Nibribacter ruber TaxID=2698458 RepID=A0A6P1P4C7_9BACT|nr:Crp/Fnr family transcriptional regulator [Nibribacter ruber]QHL89241.1 cyclic nucleotide-binding domain-containing protein [Nibribacter ruber]
MEEQFFTEYRTRVSHFLQAHPAVLARYQSTVVTVPAQSELLQQGEKPKGVYVLASGLVKVTRATANGPLFTLGVFGPGEMEGDVEAILDIPYICTVHALTHCTFHYLSRDKFLQMLAQEPDFNLLVHTSMASKLVNTSLQTSIQSTNRLYYTLLIVLRELAQISDLHITKSLLTEFLGTSQRNLNRLLGQLEEERLVQVKGATILHIHPSQLEKRISTYDFQIQ